MEKTEECGRCAMRWCLYLCLPFALLMIACSDDSEGGDAGVGQDTSVGQDLGQADDAGPGQDTGPAGEAGAIEAGTAVPCTTGDTCSGGLSCLCCGSIGPSEICLCSKECSVDNDCSGTGLPMCNKRNGADAGICTPTGYNCCWDCQ
jgi:hypothetical protein